MRGDLRLLGGGGSAVLLSSDVIGQTPSSGKAPFGVEVDPLDKDTTRYFALATAANRTTG